jgi:hypothetical protein
VPPPLIIKRAKPAPMLRSIAVLAMVIVPIAVLIVLAVTGRTVHLDNPLANTVAHVCLLAIPMVWAKTYFAQRLDILPNSETVLARGTIWSSFSHTWWMTVLLWPAPLVTFHVLGRRGLDIWTDGAATLTTTPGFAFLIMVLTFAMSVFYGTITFERKEVRVSDEGMRVDLLHFLEWPSVHHVSRRRNAYDIYHRANERLPFAAVVLKDPKAQATFEEHLHRHGVADRERTHASYHALRATTGLAAFALLELGVTAETIGDLGGGWVIALTFVTGLGLTALLERIRQVKQVTRIQPQIELADPVEPERAPLGEVMQIQDPAELSIALSNIVFRRFQQLGFARLNQAEQVFHCVDWLEREVNNGGFELFFTNTAGDLARDTVDALGHIGAPNAAVILRRAMDLFPAGTPDPDQTARATQLEGVDRGLMSALDDEFYEYPDDLARLLQRYVLEHREHFEEAT